ncbi:hypothetical protein [Streptomyces cylindrosporus]|uniref:Uncharacterized protein n=1 Tax=Streptomyces cylindrosporus TaxID=2927583 RepID=A0ABS9Y1U0_9ACTN|nr:hypothetical protein [Streptomyces cylindrosporus]MCI3270656.1 hypothetical protein [Streptomyces cylindrosporus]
MGSQAQGPELLLSTDVDALLAAAGAVASSRLDREYRILRGIVGGAAAIAALDSELLYL